MHHTNKKITLNDVHNDTYWAKSIVDEVVKYVKAYLAEEEGATPGREKRIKAHLCPCCCYIRRDRIGGQAITTTNCSHCDKEMTFGSTCTDKLCDSCAEKLELCKRCGSDIDLRNRRKLEKA